jgi:hypothetical protein
LADPEYKLYAFTKWYLDTSPCKDLKSEFSNICLALGKLRTFQAGVPDTPLINMPILALNKKLASTLTIERRVQQGW